MVKTHQSNQHPSSSRYNIHSLKTTQVYHHFGDKQNIQRLWRHYIFWQFSVPWWFVHDDDDNKDDAKMKRLSNDTNGQKSTWKQTNIFRRILDYGFVGTLFSKWFHSSSLRVLEIFKCINVFCSLAVFVHRTPNCLPLYFASFKHRQPTNHTLKH